ncbi:MAG: hypothetical protein FWC36_03770 [Spirochaetes bacterium]|nr:hypothetical protein [Spirochaetota bacterium]
MKKENLTLMLVAYRNGFLTREKLVEAISLFVYKFPARTYKWREEECSEFFSYFYPKIAKIIDTFKVAEAPFEAYLIKTLRLQIKTFALKRTAEDIGRKVLKNKEFWSFNNYGVYLAETHMNDFYKKDSQPTCTFIEKIFSDDRVKYGNRNKTLKKRVLFLVLKNISIVKEAEIPAIAEILGCGIEWLYEIIFKIRQKLEKKIKRKQLLEGIRNKYFCKLYQFHEFLSDAEVAEEKEKYYAEINKIKSRISIVTEKISMVETEPNHKDIAEVMNVPTGSVNSGLFYLKLYFEEMIRKQNISSHEPCPEFFADAEKVAASAACAYAEEVSATPQPSPKAGKPSLYITKW